MDWAEPEVEVDEDTMAAVKILYVRNLMLQTTEETIEKEFNSLKPGTRSQNSSKDLTTCFRMKRGMRQTSLITGAVERVKKIRDYAFVHFTQREDAIAAMNALNGKVRTSLARLWKAEQELWIQSLIYCSVVRVKFYTPPLQVVDSSPIEVTLAKPVDKDSYVRYTRGTGGRGGSLLQPDYTTYTLGQVGC